MGSMSSAGNRGSDQARLSEANTWQRTQVFLGDIEIRGELSIGGLLSHNITVDGSMHVLGNIEAEGNVTCINLAHQGDLGFFETTPIAKRTGVAVTAAGIHAALVAYGLISA